MVGCLQFSSPAWRMAARDGAVECELVEDGGAFVAHRSTDAAAPAASPSSTVPYAPEARLTSADGDVSMGLVLVDGDEPARFDQVTTGRAAIFTAGRPVQRRVPTPFVR